MTIASHNATLFLLGQICASLFFGILFLQSSLDKIFNHKGNKDYLTTVFSTSFLKNSVSFLFPIITILELSAGSFSALGAVMLYWGNAFFAQIGIAISGLALICLFFGQRVAKDYAGAASLSSYFAVYLLAVLLLF